MIRQAGLVFKNSFLLLWPWVRRSWIPDVGYGASLLVVGIFIALQIVAQLLLLRGNWYINDYGIGVLFGNLGLAAAICGFAAVGARKVRPISAFAYAVASMSVFTVLMAVASLLLLFAVMLQISLSNAMGWIIWVALMGAVGVVAFRSGKALSGVKSNGAGFLVLLATWAGLTMLPYIPLIGSEENYTRTDLIYLARWLFAPVQNSNSAADDLPPRIDWEKVMASQPELVSSSLAKVKPADVETPHAYFIGMAPNASQRVFERELHASQEIFEHHFNAAGRSILLQNAEDSRDTSPLATVTNLEQTAKGLASKINPETDVVVLFITTHGARETLSVESYPLPLNDIKPQDIRYALSLTGARSRVVIISACYSGSFIESLRDENTIVITAADADHTSFGCANDREWTYFTNAFFNHGLRETRDLKAAFAIANELVGKWERKMKITESHPQISVGKNAAQAWQNLIPSFDQSISTSTPSSEDAL